MALKVKMKNLFDFRIVVNVMLQEYWNVVDLRIDVAGVIRKK